MISLLFPKECLVCSKTGLWLCKICQKHLFSTLPNCCVCKKLSNGFETHAGCLKENSFKSIVTFWKYNEYSKKLVHNFKYKHRYRVGEFLFSLLEPKLRKINFEDSLLVPLPSHSTKTLERGFNPTQLFCEMISEKMKVDMNTKLVWKKEKNVSQASLNYEKRKENVQGVFEVNKSEIDIVKSYKQILLVDDILTTGSTMQELCQEVKKNIDIDIRGICLFQGSFKKKNDIIGNECKTNLQPSTKKKEEV